MALKWLIVFKKKIARIAFAAGPHSGNVFSYTPSSQPITFKIVFERFVNKQM